MQVTGAFLKLSLIAIVLNIHIGIALVMAEWDSNYTYLGLFAMPSWAIILLLQVRLFVRHIKQFNNLKENKNA